MNGATFHLVMKDLNCDQFLFNMVHIKFYQILSIHILKYVS